MSDARDIDDALLAEYALGLLPSEEAAPLAARIARDPALAARLSAGSLERAEADLLAAGLADLDVLGPTVADAALLDELVHLLGPVPASPEESETSLFLDDDSEYAEIVTTADRLSVQREVDPFDLPHRTYAHVLVDEAQDVTPMQWRMLRRRGASASWTIVGDGAQSSWPDAAEAERALRDIIGTAPVRRFRMSTNYRSPSEVFDLASRVVVEAYPEADLPTACRSTGVEPLLAVGQDLRRDVVEQVRALLGQVDGTVGVVCPPSRRDTVLADLEGASLEGAERIAVVTSLESKGLEYDGVLVVTPDDVVAESPGGVRSLYVSLTRPTQRLVTLDEGRPGRWRPTGT